MITDEQIILGSRYLQPWFLAPLGVAPLYRDYKESNLIAKKAAKYNQGKPKDEKLITENNDKYFHQHAMYQAAQKGIWSARLAEALGYGKELWDAYRDRNTKTPEAIIAEAEKDLQNNKNAIRMGLRSNRPVDEVIIPNDTVRVVREKIKNGEL